MEIITLMPFGLPGKIYRSVMPFADYDPQGKVMDVYFEKKISSIMILSEKKEWPLISGKNLEEIYQNTFYETFHFPITDFGVPDLAGFRNALDKVILKSKAGKNIAVHCLAGIGRTGLFMAFLAQDILNLSPQDSIFWVRQFIPGAIETEEQIRFIKTKSGQILSN